LENVEDFNELSVHIASTLAAGIPNFYGHQRYGRDGFNLRLAQELAAKSKKLRRNDKRLRYASDAAQAAIFDAVIAGRLAENRLHQATVGDVCMLPNGACFVVEAQEVDEVNKRLSQQEISCTGPLPGTHCKAAQDPAADDELRWSQHLGIHWQEFAKGGTLCSRGGRRPATVQFLEAPLLSGNESDSDKATLTFALGAGNYASNVAQAFDIQWQRPNGG
jgi:tRNA pseudouridine13 synthase